MKTTNITYHKVFNLGDYSNEKIGVDIQIEPGEDPQAVLDKAKRFVDNQHQLSKGRERYLQACEMINSPQDYTGRQIEQAKKWKDEYEAMATTTPRLLL